MTITSDDVRAVARLAQLHLDPAEQADMVRQLDRILSYIDQLQDVATDQIEPLAHPLEMTNVFRNDQSRDSLSVEQALANAPARDGDFFVVPAVFDNPPS